MRRRMLASIGGAKMPTARDYVQDGLVLHFDAIENRGYGVNHENGSVRWLDLVSGGVKYFNPYNGGTFLANSFVAPQRTTGYVGRYDDSQNGFISTYQSYKTVEVGFKIGTFTNRGCVVTFGMSAARRIYLIDGLVVCGPSPDGTGRSVAANTDAESVLFCSFYGASTSASNAVQGAYVNGVSKSVSNSGVAWETGNEARIGYMSTGVFCGDVYSIRCYDRVLTPTEITTNYEIDKVRFGLT